jgi:DnaJ-domain-containing protein 1
MASPEDRQAAELEAGRQIMEAMAGPSVEQLKAEMEELRRDQEEWLREYGPGMCRDLEKLIREVLSEQSWFSATTATTDQSLADLSQLGLSPPVTAIGIRKAYLALAKKHHPDPGGDAETFMQIKDAYERLTKTKK